MLTDLYKGTQATEFLGHDPDSGRSFADPHGGRPWFLAAALDVRDEDTGEFEGQPHRPGRASTRRSVRALQQRALVECQMLDVEIPQYGLVYDGYSGVTRRALVVRLTAAGHAFVHQHDLAKDDDFDGWWPGG